MDIPSLQALAASNTWTSILPELMLGALFEQAEEVVFHHSHNGFLAGGQGQG